jgi:hypothetical protein
VATPILYAKYAATADSALSRHRRKFTAAIVAMCATAFILERVFLFGPTPGRALFVFMLLYFACVMPLIAFPRPLPAQPWTLRYASWAWIRAVVCTVWASFCIWGMQAGFRG